MKELKHLMVSVLTLIVSMNCLSLSGQEAEESNNAELRKFGIGLNFEQNVSNLYYYYYYPVTSQLIFTYNLAGKFRMEPEFGFNLLNYHDDYDKIDEKSNELVMGISGYGLASKNSVFIIYGIKFNYLHSLHKRDNNTESKSTINTFSIGPVIGIDYLVSSHFSVGADFKILYLSELYKYDYDDNDNVVEESFYKNLKTAAALKFRFYF